MRHARQLIEEWRIEYNSQRPHSSIGYLTPDQFADTFLLQTLWLFRTNWGSRSILLTQSVGQVFADVADQTVGTVVDVTDGLLEQRAQCLRALYCILGFVVHACLHVDARVLIAEILVAHYFLPTCRCWRVRLQPVEHDALRLWLGNVLLEGVVVLNSNFSQTKQTCRGRRTTNS